VKIAEAQKIEFESDFPRLEDISARLDEQKEKLLIDAINWKEYNYKPEVILSIAYSDHELFLKYLIKENYFKAEKTDSNQMVCEDSCVEFFVSPQDDGIYYNMEFNAIGTCLFGAGTDRASNERVKPEIISKIRRLTTAGRKPITGRSGEFVWAITIAIPFDVFFLHQIKNLNSKTFRVNFYKCGDKLEVPHYVTWNPVGTEKPDFHQSEHFGLLKFV
jgi:hypothetical protein